MFDVPRSDRSATRRIWRPEALTALWAPRSLAIASAGAGLAYLASESALWSAIGGLAGAVVGLVPWTGATGEADSQSGAARSSASAAAAAAAWRDASIAGNSLQVLLEGLHDAALVLDADGVVMAANAPAKLLFPVTFGRHVSQTSRSPEFLALVDKAIVNRTQQKGEARIFATVEHHLSIIVTPLRSDRAPGQPNLVLVLRDLSDHEQLSRMRADFIANASHELRTPLASLKGFMETLLGPARDDAAARDRFISIMQEQADRMSRVIDDLLSLSRIEMREHVRPLDLVDLRDVVQYVAKTVEPLGQKADVTVTMEIPNVPMIIRGEREELIQLTQNLAHNAIKYGRRGGETRIGLVREGDSAVLSVTDDGIGIAREHLPRLTERFYRVSAKDSRERGGTGLGLAIVKHIINRHQGELRVESQLGRGSKFSVRLPALASSVAVK